MSIKKNIILISGQSLVKFFFVTVHRESSPPLVNHFNRHSWGNKMSGRQSVDLGQRRRSMSVIGVSIVVTQSSTVECGGYVVLSQVYYVGYAAILCHQNRYDSLCQARLLICQLIIPL